MAANPPSVTEFREAFPEFTEPLYADAKVTRAASIAHQMSAVTADATLYLTAHLLVIGGEDSLTPDGGSGVVVDESAAGQRVTYEKQAEETGDAFYFRTSYGRMFRALERRAPRRVFGPRVYG